MGISVKPERVSRSGFTSMDKGESNVYRIYLVEDEQHLSDLLAAYLAKEGWQIRTFSDGESAKKAIPERPDLWILDIMLPGQMDGYQLVREIKTDEPELPVIFISARDADIDRVIGLELGSDDYVAKPFLPRELVVRTKKLLDRVYGRGMAADNGSRGGKARQAYCGYYLDEAARTVIDANGVQYDLTSKEFDLLLYFAKHPGLVLEREQVLNAVWGSDYFGSERVVDDLVRRIRRKMTDVKLETVYGIGYRAVRG